MSDLHLIETPGGPAGFPYPENHVRARLGLGKDEIRLLRQQHLNEATGWRLHKKRIWLSPLGVQALIDGSLLETLQKKAAAVPGSIAGDGEALNAASPPDGVSQKMAAQKAAVPEVVYLKVVQLTRNPHIVQACGTDESALAPQRMVRVRVRSSKNFIRHMVIPATLVAGYKDLYDLARACPRQKGKW